MPSPRVVAGASGRVQDPRQSRHWQYDLGDELPWDTWERWEDKEVPYAELTTWLACHAPTRLQAHGALDELLQRIRLLGGCALARLQVLRSSGRGPVLLV